MKCIHTCSPPPYEFDEPPFVPYSDIDWFTTFCSWDASRGCSVNRQGLNRKEAAYKEAMVLIENQQAS